MGESKALLPFLLLFRNGVNLLDCPSLRILDFSPILAARYLSQVFLPAAVNRLGVGAVCARHIVISVIGQKFRAMTELPRGDNE
jgi:hypothetical protein